jgi:tRNA/tmRNA/rRNA uracil-C5-methylase (TrmA/RlmC/RlmD family)
MKTLCATLIFAFRSRMRSDASREAITQVLENGLERETEGSESGDEKNAHEQENQGILRQALSTSSSQMTVSDVHRVPFLSPHVESNLQSRRRAFNPPESVIRCPSWVYF